MNQALLGKASWRITNQDQGLWASMFRKKSFFGTCSFDPNAEFPSASSSTWKSILYGSEVLQQGFFWRVGNGRSLRFFTFSGWLLLELNTIPTDFFNMDELVADYLIEGQWNLDKLREVVSTDVLSLIMNTPTK